MNNIMRLLSLKLQYFNININKFHDYMLTDSWNNILKLNTIFSFYFTYIENT